MQIELVNRPSATAAIVRFARGERFVAEPDAMIAMSTRVALHTDSRGGGMLGGIKRLFSGESFFLNTFEALDEGQELVLAPQLPGDVERLPLRGGRLLVQQGAWLGSSDGVKVSATNQGLTVGLFGGQGLFWVECQGQGEVLVSSFGAISALDVDGELIVDTSHIVAHEDTLKLAITKANPSLIGSFVGGEGLALRVSGRGRLWLQSHNPGDFGAAIAAALPPRRG